MGRKCRLCCCIAGKKCIMQVGFFVGLPSPRSLGMSWLYLNHGFTVSVREKPRCQHWHELSVK